MLRITVKHELVLATLVNGLMVWLLVIGGSEPPLLMIWLRLIVGLVFLLFMPGFLLQSLLFGDTDALNAIERIALSMGISVALVPLVALVLDALPWGLRLESIVIASVLLTTLLAIIGEQRRTPETDALLVIPLNTAGSWWREQDHMNRVLYGVMGLALLSMLYFSIEIITQPSPGAKLTAFYLLGSEELAESYPQTIAAGETVMVIVGISNQEGRTSEYRINVLHDDQIIGQLAPLMLEDGETLETPIKFTPEDTGHDLEINILLYRDDAPQPYRTLRLWLNVTTASVGVSGTDYIS